MEKFSIILPVYNGGEYVKECVNSILAQTYSGFNLLVLDNNSNDGTAEWVRSLQDERIIIHSSPVKLSIEENWGCIRSIPKNEFITLIGHDDILLPGYLEEMNRLIEKFPDAGLYQTHFTYINSVGELIRECKPMDEVQSAQEFLACQFKRNIDSTGTGYMMRSSDYDKLGGIPTGYPNLIFADYQLWVGLSMISYKAVTKKICFQYRVHDSVSKLTNGEAYQSAFEKYIYFITELSKQNAEVKEVVEKYGHEFLMYNCESLSHRILKTPVAERKITVKEFIDKCRQLASVFIPDQVFEPEKKFRINIAALLDSSSFGRLIFKLYKLFDNK